MTANETKQLLENGCSTTLPRGDDWLHFYRSENVIARRKWKCGACLKPIDEGQPFTREDYADEEGYHIHHNCWACALESGKTEPMARNCCA